MNETNWVPGIIVLAVGLVLAIAVLVASRKKTPAAAKDTRLADLEQKLQLLLEQLRGLEAERHQLGERFGAEKTRLELEAAAAMKARDQYLKERGAAVGATAVPSSAGASNTSPSTGAVTGAGATAAATATSAPPMKSGFFGRHPELKGALWGAGIVGVLVLAGVLITREQKPRDDGTPMVARPAQQSGATPAAAPDEDPHFQSIYERAKQNPQDTQASSYVAHELIRQQRFDEAEKLTKQALAADPFHLESRIHAAVLRATRGEFRPALDELGKLARTYPDSYEAMLFRGALAMQVGESSIALESFERFKAEAPADEVPPQLDSAIAMLRERVRAQ